MMTVFDANNGRPLHTTDIRRQTHSFNDGSFAFGFHTAGDNLDHSRRHTKTSVIVALVIIAVCIAGYIVRF